MKRSLRTILGATLLEVMLVLSIVGLIILMSVKYYQSATNSSQIQQLMGIVQAITAAADNIAASGTGYGSATASNIKAIAGANSLVTPWGSTVSIGTGTTSYTVTIPSVPTGVCNTVKLKLATNTKFQGPPACSASGLTYTYNPSS